MSNRVIKFRVWIPAYNEMFYDAGIIKHPIDKKDEYFYLLPNGQKRGNFATGDFDCPEHVWEQFTGLLDKNGKEIYEGDVISFISHNQNGESIRYRGIIEYYKYGYFITYRTKWDYSTHEFPAGHVYSEEIGFHKTDFEIIGNIHQNPDLLT